MFDRGVLTNEKMKVGAAAYEGYSFKRLSRRFFGDNGYNPAREGTRKYRSDRPRRGYPGGRGQYIILLSRYQMRIRARQQRLEDNRRSFSAALYVRRQEDIFDSRP